MPLTKVPAPGWRDFLPLLKFSSLPEPLDSASVWLCMNGRNAIYHALNALGIRHGSVVLLPALHCTAMVDPVLAFGARVQYYTVNRDFSLNPDEIESSVKQGAAAILYVHFLGFPAPVDELLEISRRYGVRLIEDCTHALFGMIGARPMGTFGDAAIFSFRKTLPVPDGGALVLSHDVQHRVFKLSSAPWMYQARMIKWTFDSWRSKTNDSIMANSSDARVPSQSMLMHKRNYRKGPDSHEDPEFIQEWLNWPISWLSKWFVRRADPNGIRQKRAINYLRLHTQLSSVDGLIPCFPELLQGISPFGYPFIAESEQRADYRLRDLGVPAFSFGEILHESLSVASFPEAQFLSKNLVILPIHQGLSENDLDKIVGVVKKFF